MHQRRYHILVADQNEVSLNRAVKLLKRRDYVVAGVLVEPPCPPPCRTRDIR
jgi:hypothetical protein